jgi:hypothetical protein
MNWSYIAGFFDGEGCVSKANAKHCDLYAVHMAQHVKQDEVIYRIKDFLVEKGIPVRLYRERNTFKQQEHFMTRLVISKQCDVEKFLKAVLSLLLVKRKNALLALEAARVSLARKERSRRNLKKAVAMYRDGDSLLKLSKTFHLCTKDIRAAVALNGIAVRPRGTNQTYRLSMNPLSKVTTMSNPK